MMLIEVSEVSADVLPILPLKQTLRLGSGFGEDDAQDSMLEGYLRAALSAIEGRTGQVIFRRQFDWLVDRWTGAESQAFPLAPVISVDTVATVDADGAEAYQAAETMAVQPDPFAPRLQARTGTLPAVPKGGRVRVRVTAGAATTWDGVPPDLAQAVLLMAGHYYEFRHDLSLSKGCTPFGVTALLERYRPLRIGLGARA